MTLATAHAGTALPFIHRFEPASRAGAPPLVLLHGTGGDESDLLALGRAIAPGSALLSPRGQVLENGMPRFFRRLSPGVFDEADITRRAHDLADFVDEARDTYDFAMPIAVGLSNDANIAAAALMLRPASFAAVALLRGMVPFTVPPNTALEGKQALLLSGLLDPIVPPENSARLAAQLLAAGADVQHVRLPASHSLTDLDVRHLSTWITELT